MYIHVKEDSDEALMRNLASCLPKRVQRYAIIYLPLLVIAWLAWRHHLGPKYAAYRQELRDMDAEPPMSFGKNSRPHFKDMIQLHTLDERHLPHGNKRLVIVGDVHGCIGELKDLLKKVDFDKHRDHLILTGDIVSKGPDSPGVVSLAKSLGASCVRGNHEDKLLLNIAALEANQSSRDITPDADEYPDLGEEGVDEDSYDEKSYSTQNRKQRHFAKQFNKEQISWLQKCPVILHVGKIRNIGDVVVVHAGLVPGIPLEHQDPYNVMNMRTINLKTRVPSENREYTHWEKLWNHAQRKLHKEDRVTVVYGHDARRGKNIQKYSKGLDSSCVKGGRLTALVIDARGREKYVQVKCKGYVK